VRGAWVGLDFITQAHLMRAALELLLPCDKVLLEATGLKATELRLAGGGTVKCLGNSTD